MAEWLNAHYMVVVACVVSAPASLTMIGITLEMIPSLKKRLIGDIKK
jgi:hypothetical protein